MQKKFIPFSIVIIFLTLSLCACTGPSNDQKTSDHKQPVSKKQFDSDGFTIAYCDTSQLETWRIQMLAEFEQAAGELKTEGIIDEYYVTNANGDPAKQINDINNMIQKGVDGIILCATSPTAIQSAVDDAMNAGIKVVNLNSLVKSNNVTSKIYQSDIAFGQICADFIVNKLNGKGNILVLNGIAGSEISNERWIGAENVFKEYPDIHILSTAYADRSYDKGYQATLDLLNENAEIDGVWSQGGAMTQGAIDAFQEKELPLVPMSGEASNGFLRTWIECQKSTSFDSICPNYTATISVTALNTLIDALKGKKVSQEIELPIDTITSENIYDYYRSDLNDNFWCDTQLSDANLKKLYQRDEE